MIMGTTNDQRLHTFQLSGAVDHCLDAATSIERALDESRQLAEHHDRLVSTIKDCLECYDDFELFWADVDRAWTASPAVYSPDLHRNLRDLDRRFRQVFEVLAEAIARYDGCRVEQLDGAQRVLEIREVMASVEMMDHGPMPEHMRELTEAAIRAYHDGDRGAE